MSTSTAELPLSGVKVVEVATYLSGPFTGQVLGDLGATVTKVEPPGGDPYRRFGPQDEYGGLLFRAVNRNKSSQFVDLKSEEGMAQLHDLLSESDVLVSNWRPGVAARLGLTDTYVRERWPQLIWVRISGYGQDGPLADMPAFDSVIQARTGTVAAFGLTELRVPPMYLGDKVAAMTAVQAVLVSLLQRMRSGQGTIADVAMLDSLAYFNGPDVFAGYQRADHYEARVERHLNAHRPLATADGAMVVNPVSGKQLKRALEAAGLADRADRLKAAPDSTTMAEMFYDELAGPLQQKSTAHWVKLFADADVPASEVLTVQQHLGDAQVAHSQLYTTANVPGEGPVRRIRYPARFDGRPLPLPDVEPSGPAAG